MVLVCTTSHLKIFFPWLIVVFQLSIILFLLAFVHYQLHHCLCWFGTVPFYSECLWYLEICQEVPNLYSLLYCTKILVMGELQREVPGLAAPPDKDLWPLGSWISLWSHRSLSPQVLALSSPPPPRSCLPPPSLPPATSAVTGKQRRATQPVV
jgi:hypothetical protein